MQRNPNCTACPLHQRACTVCIWGEGPVPADLMIVGMAPGATEDVRGRPFVGPAGEILNTALAEAHLDRAHIYITNTVKCFPGRARKPTRAEIATCTDTYLRWELEQVRPRLIVAMGDLAMLALTNRSGVMAHRGQILELRPGFGLAIPVLVTYHPAAYLHAGRDPRIVQAMRADFIRARDFLRGASPYLDVRPDETVLAEPVVALDTETDAEGNLLVGTLGVADGRYVVFGITDAAAVLARLRPDVHLVAWNARFDLAVLNKHGIVLPSHVKITDPMLLLHLLDSGRQGRYNLEAAVLDEFGHADAEWLASKRRVHQGEQLPLSELTRYCAQDSVLTARLFAQFRERIRQFPQLIRLYRTLVRPVAEMLAVTEATPVPLDRDYLKRLDEDLSARITMLGDELAQLAGLDEVPNFRSHKVLAEVLYQRLALPVVKVTDGGAPSTDKMALMELVHLSPFVERLLVYRKLNKLRSAYVQRWLRRYATAPYYATYNLIGTVTGRLSSDFQQVPRPSDDPELPNIRDAVAAPPGFVILEADFNMLELRLIAWHAPEPTLLELIRQGADVHWKTAVEVVLSGADRRYYAQMLVKRELPSLSEAEAAALLLTEEGRELTKIIPALALARHVGKTLNFSLAYGAAPAKVAEILRLAMTTAQVEDLCYLLKARTLLDAARRLHAAWHAAYPGIRQWHAREGQLIQATGRAVAPHGRIRWLPKAQSDSREERAEAVREGCNHVIQSLASDLTLLAAVQAAPVFRAAGALGPWPTHDSLLWVVPEGAVADLAHQLKVTMEGVGTAARDLWGVSITVPLVAEVKVGPRWGSVRDLTAQT